MCRPVSAKRSFNFASVMQKLYYFCAELYVPIFHIFTKIVFINGADVMVTRLFTVETLGGRGQKESKSEQKTERESSS